MTAPRTSSAPTCSAQYLFVRGRQLEGTFPGNAETGTWPITALRIQRGWGWVPEEAWPYDSSKWPPVEPERIDELAQIIPGYRYQRVRSIQEIKLCLAKWSTLVQVSLEITDKWSDPRNGKIPDLTPGDTVRGKHSVLVIGYDDSHSQIKFRNSWGANWGEMGNGYISYSAFESCWHEGWTSDIGPEATKDIGSTPPVELSWGTHEFGGGIFHCREFLDKDSKRIAWAFGVERYGVLEIEELFVMPGFRKMGYGTQLARAMRHLANENSLTIRDIFPMSTRRGEILRSSKISPRNSLCLSNLVESVGLPMRRRKRTEMSKGASIVLGIMRTVAISASPLAEYLSRQ